jgi:hypothetical protein
VTSPFIQGGGLPLRPECLFKLLFREGVNGTAECNPSMGRLVFLGSGNSINIQIHPFNDLLTFGRSFFRLSPEMKIKNIVLSNGLHYYLSHWCDYFCNVRLIGM